MIRPFGSSTAQHFRTRGKSTRALPASGCPACDWGSDWRRRGTEGGRERQRERERRRKWMCVRMDEGLPDCMCHEAFEHFHS